MCGWPSVTHPVFLVKPGRLALGQTPQRQLAFGRLDLGHEEEAGTHEFHACFFKLHFAPDCKQGKSDQPFGRGLPRVASHSTAILSQCGAREGHAKDSRTERNLATGISSCF